MKRHAETRFVYLGQIVKKEWSANSQFRGVFSGRRGDKFFGRG